MGVSFDTELSEAQVQELVARSAAVMARRNSESRIGQER
jgi:hypothetical protein